MKFACFGGAAAVADEAVAVARHSRGKSFFRNKGQKSPSRSKASSTGTTNTKRITSPGRRETDFDIYMIATGKQSPSSSALSTAASLDSAYASSSSSLSCSSSRSSSYSSLSSLDATPAQPARRRVQPEEHKGSPAAGVAAVLVILVMMTFGGRLAATMLTAAVLCFFPRRWPASLPRAFTSSPEPVVASRREAEAINNTKAVTDGFLVRNRNKF